jgi:hypothetical protein
MQNFDVLENNMIQLPTGVFAGVDSCYRYPGGELEGIKLSEKNMLVTHAGELVPAYTETHRRKNKDSVEFYKNGMIKAVALDELQEIQTPIGEFPAELVTFFDTGELKRFFPLDGKISGLWTEEEEKNLAIPLSFQFPFASFTAIISGVAFYKSGDIRSITLFPGEAIDIHTECGMILTRNGFSLYEDSGELESLEPAGPTVVKTPLGAITAFDPNAVGINADVNSLIFDENSRVSSLITVHNRIAAQTEDGRMTMWAPREVVNPLDNESMMTEGLRISFDYGKNTVTLADGQKEAEYPLSATAFTITAHDGPSMFGTCSPSACASCSLGCK